MFSVSILKNLKIIKCEMKGVDCCKQSTPFIFDSIFPMKF